MADEKKANPTGDKTSLIRPYSLGIAAANLIFGQKELEIVPIEDMSHLDGEISDLQTKIESTGVDAKGQTYATSQTVSNSIRATWLPLDSYRPFPGLVRRGEKLMIWRVADTDKYYWTEMGLDSTVRRRDILTILVPNSQKEGQDSQTHETAYFIEVNTVDKHITIQTNKNDGEQFAYILQLNPGSSNATLCDDAGNYIQLDSKAQKVNMMNQSGSEIWIEKTKAGITATDEIIFQTKKLTMNATGSATLTTKTYTVSAPTSYTLNGGTVQITGKGAVNINGAGVNVASSAGLGFSGASGTAMSGPSMSFNVGTLTHNGVNVGQLHIHPLDIPHGVTLIPR